jgi:hypothetical protein
MQWVRAQIRVRGLETVIVHLLEYRVLAGHDAEVAGFLRHRALAEPPRDGLVCRFAGRRLSQQGREHIAATTWRDEFSFAHGTDAEGVPAYLAPESVLLGDKASSRYRVIASTGLGCEGARVLRLYRTSIAADTVEQWARRALEPVDQLATKRGLLTVVAGVDIESEATPQTGEVRVVVLTAWSEWDLLLGATGGRLNRALLDTELADLERPATADHFELLEAEPGPG